MSWRIEQGDCLEVLRTVDAESIDAVVTDPPYEFGFMGKHWDASGVAFQVETWAAVSRVLKPGAHLLAFGGTRTSHRMTCAIEDAGFEIRDCLMWLYGSGFPKSLDVSKAIDKVAGAEREAIGMKTRPDGTIRPNKGNWTPGTASTYAQDEWTRQNMAKGGNYDTAAATDLAKQWQGWGTALKPAYEPIVLARKPLAGTVAQTVKQYGTGALNIDGCRIEGIVTSNPLVRNAGGYEGGFANQGPTGQGTDSLGRWPVISV